MLKKRKRKSTHLSIIRTWSQKISKFRMCPTHWPHWAFMSIYKELVFSILLSPTLVRKKKSFAIPCKTKSCKHMSWLVKLHVPHLYYPVFNLATSHLPFLMYSKIKTGHILDYVFQTKLDTRLQYIILSRSTGLSLKDGRWWKPTGCQIILCWLHELGMKTKCLFLKWFYHQCMATKSCSIMSQTAVTTHKVWNFFRSMPPCKTMQLATEI